jgi:hypothetical protein
MLPFHSLCEGALPMISDLLFSKLLLVGLLWLCILLHVVWPYDRAASHPPTPQPTLPPRKRSTDPKLFAGLLHKPLCDACEHAVEARPQAPGAPPPLLTFTRGRPRALSQITENRKVEARKSLIFQTTILRFCPKKATLRQSRS